MYCLCNKGDITVNSRLLESLGHLSIVERCLDIHRMMNIIFLHLVTPVINTSLGLMNNISIDLYEINVGDSSIVEVPYNINNVILYCVVSGRGIPSVNWTTPPLNDNYKITTSMETDGLLYVVTSLLSISNFTNDYAGIYQCNATNCGGQDSSGIIMTQQGYNTHNNHVCTYMTKLYNKHQIHKGLFKLHK